MFLLLLDLFVASVVWKKQFSLIIAGSPSHYKRDGGWSPVYSQKNGECSFSSKMGEIGKIVKEGFLL